MIDLQRPKWQLEIIWLAGQLGEQAPLDLGILLRRPAAQKFSMEITLKIGDLWKSQHVGVPWCRQACLSHHQIVVWISSDSVFVFVFVSQLSDFFLWRFLPARTFPSYNFCKSWIFPISPVLWIFPFSTSSHFPLSVLTVFAFRLLFEELQKPEFYIAINFQREKEGFVF